MQIVLRWERTRWLAEAGESESPCQRTGRYRFVRGLHLGTSDHRRTRGRSARSDRGAPQPGLRPWKSFSVRHCRMYGCCDGCGNDRRLLPGPFSTSSPGEFCPLGRTRNRSGNPGSPFGSTSVSGLPQFCYAEDEWNEPRLITFVESRKHRHKILPGAVNDPVFNSSCEVAELPPHRLMMLCRFFQDYKMLEAKPVEVDEIEPRQGRCRSLGIHFSETVRTGDGVVIEMMPGTQAPRHPALTSTG